MIFEKPGKQNTEKTLELAIAAARERGIEYIVFASGGGYTGSEILKLDTEGLKLVMVTSAPNPDTVDNPRLSLELRKQIEDAGIKIVQATHVLSGAERSFSKKYGGISTVEVVADSLRMFSQGTKVCLEVAVMALDAGTIPYMTPIIAVGGTGFGADTAIVMRTAFGAELLKNKLDEIVCKPKLL